MDLEGVTVLPSEEKRKHGHFVLLKNEKVIFTFKADNEQSMETWVRNVLGVLSLVWEDPQAPEPRKEKRLEKVSIVRKVSEEHISPGRTVDSDTSYVSPGRRDNEEAPSSGRSINESSEGKSRLASASEETASSDLGRKETLVDLLVSEKEFISDLRVLNSSIIEPTLEAEMEEEDKVLLQCVLPKLSVIFSVHDTFLSNLEDKCASFATSTKLEGLLRSMVRKSS